MALETAQAIQALEWRVFPGGPGQRLAATQVAIREALEKARREAPAAWARQSAEMADGARQADAMQAAIERGMTTEAEVRTATGSLPAVGSFHG